MCPFFTKRNLINTFHHNGIWMDVHKISQGVSGKRILNAIE